MLTELAGGANIIALSFEGRLEKGDVERAMHRLDTAFKQSGPVHLFIEVRDFKGMAGDAWLSDLGHGLHYLTRLKQFGRVAIVSRQSWIRTASRIESALLPFVKYEVYTPEQRDQALAWVKGEVGEPHPSPLRIVEDADGDIFAFEIDGRITPAAIDALYDRFSQWARSDRKLRILARIKCYDGFDPAVLINPKYLDLKLSLLRHVERYAIVGAPEWMHQAADFASPLLRFELRHFSSEDEAGARDWLHSAGNKGRAKPQRSLRIARICRGKVSRQGAATKRSFKAPDRLLEICRLFTCMNRRPRVE